MGKPRSRRKLACLALLLGIGSLVSPASARDFNVGELEGLFDLTLAYGILARVEGRDDRLVGVAHGGSALSVNFDDATLNYDTGIVSNMVQATGELTLRWRRLGGYARAVAFYDFENELDDRERTELSNDALRIVGSDVKLRDAYLSGRFELRGMPVQVRVGDQVINWGETGFLRFGVDVVNPVDLVALLQPTSTTRDLFLPQGMLWAAANVTETVSVEGFYQYDWEAVRLPAVGWFFSSNDTIGADGLNFVLLGSGLYSDQGTDLDAQFALPGLGHDPDFGKIFPAGKDKPSDQGQYGFTVQTMVPRLNASKLALHFVNYHARLPLISGFTADQEAIAATSQDAVQTTADALAPRYEETGLSPDEAAEQALATASELTLSEFANETRYFAKYPEDVKMLGLTFNTATIRTGTLLAGEVSHHFDWPLQIWVSDVLKASLSPIQFDPSFKDNPLGEFGANEIVPGFIRRDKTQMSFGLTQLFGPRLGAAQSLINFDIGWVHVHDMPNKKKLPLNAPGLTPTGDPARPLPFDRFPTADSWGYRLIGQLTYASVFGGLNFKPRVVWIHDVDGVTPGPGGPFIEGRKSFSVGLAVEFTNTWTVDLSYTNIFGAGRYNLLNDRDFIRFNVMYYY